jgi:NAD(P)-dependent dehydrogenase (short-subunit alcohol dehydrogenase family)
MEREIALITGASSGFGFLTTLYLAEQGYFVIATMRNLNKAERLVTEAKKRKLNDYIDVQKLDVTNHDDLDDVFKYVQTNYGWLDILINNAGYCLGGVTEYANMSEWEEQLNTNVLGVIAVTKAFIPMMRKNRSGKIINIGSISGRFGFPGMGAYVTSKFALSGFSESLRLELIPFNIKVSLIEAGSFKTSIWEKSLNQVDLNYDADYENLTKVIYQEAEETARLAEDPMKVTRLIEKICRKKEPRFRYQVGKGVKTMIVLKAILPWTWMESIVLKKLNKNRH